MKKQLFALASAAIIGILFFILMGKNGPSPIDMATFEPVDRLVQAINVLKYFYTQHPELEQDILRASQMQQKHTASQRSPKFQRAVKQQAMEAAFALLQEKDKLEQEVTQREQELTDYIRQQPIETQVVIKEYMDFLL